MLVFVLFCFVFAFFLCVCFCVCVFCFFCLFCGDEVSLIVLRHSCRVLTRCNLGDRSPIYKKQLYKPWILRPVLSKSVENGEVVPSSSVSVIYQILSKMIYMTYMTSTPYLSHKGFYGCISTLFSQSGVVVV